MKNFLISLCAWTIIFAESAKNFCDYPCMDVGRECALKINKRREECETKNTGCTDNGQFHQRCINPKMIQLDSSLKQLFVDLHNEKRNFIAGGGVPKYGPACRMATMQWDEELADVAAMLGHTCEMEHDSCRKTSKFVSPGQNLFNNYTSIEPNRPLVVREQIEYAIKSWHNEISSSRPSDMDSFPANSFYIGHFTATMTESNTHLGCGIATFHRTEYNLSYMLIICNYARSHMFGLPVFTKCNVAAENCTHGTDNKYRNLCSKREEYNVNYYTEYDIWEWDWEKYYKS